MNKQETLLKMLALVSEGTGVLTAGEIHPDIPTIHDVGDNEGRRLKTDGEVRHLGFGYFSARVGNDKVGFDGGGAMRRVDDADWSWCPYTGPVVETGYDLDAAREAILELMA